MSYVLYDADDKYLGDLATTRGLDGLYKYANRVDASHLADFLEKGAALVTQSLIDEVQKLRPADLDIRHILDNLIKMLNDAELCVIISDDVND